MVKAELWSELGEKTEARKSNERSQILGEQLGTRDWGKQGTGRTQQVVLSTGIRHHNLQIEATPSTIREHLTCHLLRGA